MSAEFLDRALRWRSIDDPCLRCQGAGNYSYPSGSTWRQGDMGPSCMQLDVCDACWGTGDRFRTGCDLRRLRDEENKRVAERAVSLIADSVGASMSVCRGDVAQIILHLERLVDKRGVHYQLQGFTNALANVLRRALGVTERKL
jgi:hypothetical protein